MRKTKIMLATISIFAIVGGAIAFKVKSGEIYCSTTTTPIEYCDIYDQATFTEDADGDLYCTINGTECNVKARIGLN